jgi:sulfur carrier protein
MNIWVNGEVLSLQQETLLLPELIERCGCGGRRIAIEVNGEVVPRSLHAGFALHEGDRVEIIQAIGGG